MKRFSFILAMLAIVLAFGLAFVSCDNDTTGGGNTPGGNTPGGNNPSGNSVVGTWVGNQQGMQVKFIFSADSTFSMTLDGQPFDTGTWTQSGNVVSLTFRTYSESITLNGNSFIFDSITFTRQ